MGMLASITKLLDDSYIIPCIQINPLYYSVVFAMLFAGIWECGGISAKNTNRQTIRLL